MTNLTLEQIKLIEECIIKKVIEPLMKRYNWYDKTKDQREGQFSLIYDEIIYDITNVIWPHNITEFTTTVLGLSPPVPDIKEGHRPYLCD